MRSMLSSFYRLSLLSVVVRLIDLDERDVSFHHNFVHSTPIASQSSLTLIDRDRVHTSTGLTFWVPVNMHHSLTALTRTSGE